MRSITLGLAAVALLFASACDYDKYVIDMRPEGDSFRRTIVCWRADDTARPPKITPVAGFKVDEIKKAYPPKSEVPDLEKGKRGFGATFAGATPQDIGGAGSCTRFRSEMGDLYLYVERFRGNPDQAAVLARAAYCADQLAELVALWFASEMKDEPRLPALLTFIRGPFREDMRNVSLYFWMPQTARNGRKGGENHAEEFAVQGAQFLSERGYLKVGDLPVLLGAMSRQQERDVTPALRLIQRLAATRMGVAQDQPAPESLGFLGDAKRVTGSYERFRQTKVYRDWLAAIDVKRVTGKVEPRLDAFDRDQPVESMVQRMAGLALWFGEDKVELTLHCNVKPFATNGTWEEPTGSVGWAEGLPPEDGLPLMVYAFWTVPDEAFQKSHFGKRILESDKLGQYVFWRTTLTPPEAREWAKFLATLKPGGELLPRVKAWRFAADRALPEGEAGAVEPGRDAIVEGIGKE